MNNKKIEGIFGEIEAAKYLKNQGYDILCKNFTCMQGEIDIVAMDKEEIVFVEVKTRTNIKYGEAKEAVDKRKQIHIYKTAEYYLYKNKIEDAKSRIDVIEIYLNNRKI